MQIACSHCGATYVFDAALIPSEGYDARCTSCQKVFFVHRDGAHSPAQAAEGQQEAPGGGFAPQSLHRGTMELGPLDEPEGPRRRQRPTVPGGIDVELDLGPRLGAHASVLRPSRHHDPDPDPMPMRRPWARRGLFLGVALVAVIGSGVVVGVVCSKRLHAPPSVQPPIHIVRAPDPIAAEAFNRGLKALWDDTAKGYVAAAKAFDAACARDKEFTDAWAGAALAALLHGTDLEAQAQQAMSDSQAVAQKALVEVAQGARRGLAEDTDEADGEGESSRDGASAAQALRLQKIQAALVQDSQQGAEALHEQAHALKRRAASLLLYGDHLMSQTPLMAMALAMWYAQDPASSQLAADQLRAFEQLIGGDCVPVQAEACDPGAPVATAPAPKGPVHLGPRVGQAPYGPLALWIEARLKAQDKAVPHDAVVAAYEAALTLQPELRRARWELAMYELRSGRFDVARPLLEDLAHGDGPHDKARAQLQKLVQRGAAAGGSL
jgi:predicted Zn finger-like uncharacterized protein